MEWWKTDIENAISYYKNHKYWILDLVKGAKIAYPPTSLYDIVNPMVWKPEHWKWFLKDYKGEINNDQIK